MSGLIGQQLGQYEITALIGKGGMATVYRARQTSINRDVAIKVIRPDLVDSGDFVVRFQREAQAVASLSHPFILKVFDYGHQDDLAYLVMELLRGGSLADVMNNGPLPLDVVSRVIDQLASALDYAHGLGIIHRDLKPQNVLLDEQGNAHLTDFGIAKILSETTVLTQTGIAMGTPAYMSPEQWMGEPLDARTDVYAFGAMLFEMLTGRLPFSAETPASLMYKHLQQPPPSIRDAQTGLPRTIDAVITKALAKDRDQRFASAGLLASAFRTALTGQLPIPVTPSHSAPDATMIETPASGLASQPLNVPLPPASPARFPGVLVGVLVVILAAVLIGGFVVLRGGQGQPTAMPTTALAALPTSTVSPATTQAAVIASATGVPSQTPTALPSATNTAAPSATLPPPSAIPSTTIVVKANAAETLSAGNTQTAQAIPPTTRPNPTATRQAALSLGSTQTAAALPSPTIAPSVTPIRPTVPPSSTPLPAATNTPIPSTVPTLVPTAVYTLPPSLTPVPTATHTLVPSPTLAPPTEALLTGQILFASNRSGKYQLYLVDAANPQAPQPVASSNADDFGPAISSDGSRIAFTSNRQGGNQIYIVGVDGSNAHRLVNVPGDNYAPAWSPDGNWIVFHNNRSGNWQLYIVRSDGSNLRRLTNDSADNTDASWAPDGIHIAFHTKQKDGSSGIFTMDVNGSTPTRLTPPSLNANDPAWSPDGQYIAFTVFKNNQPNLYLMDADGTNVRPLLSKPGTDDQPSWSPDSHFIVFRSKRNGQTGIYVVDVTGANVRQMTSSPTDNHFPAWAGKH